MDFAAAVRAGWALCPLREREKAPRGRQWNAPGAAMSEEQAAQAVGAGLMHAYSGTCALDVDDYDGTRAYLAKRGIDLDALFADPGRVGISSGTTNRAKLLYALTDPLQTRRVQEDGRVLFELRCATSTGTSIQDVLPGSIHPSGRTYGWDLGDPLLSDPAHPPPLPGPLRALWEALLPAPTPAAPTPAAPTPAAPNPSDICTHLDTLDPSLSYDEWIRVGMALHHDVGPDGFTLWDRWSAPSPKYPGTAALRQHWDSFGRHPTPVTLDSLLGPDHVAAIEDFDVLPPLPPLPPTEPPDLLAPDPFLLHNWQSIVSRPWPRWHVRDVLPQAELSMIYGPSGAGKSFLALDMALAIAQGLPWWGHDTHKGAVLWVAAEAFGSLKPRLMAYQRRTGCEPVANLHVLSQANLADPLWTRRLLTTLATLPDLALIVIDTLAAASGGANENSGEDMGSVLDACRAAHHASGASVLLIHHSGKNADLGARGWSGIRAAVQAEMRVDHDELGRTFTVTKQRDGLDGQSRNFALLPVTVGHDDEGFAIESATVQPGEVLDVRAGPKAWSPSGKTEKQLYDVIMDNLSLMDTIEVTDVYALWRAGQPSGDEGSRPPSASRALRDLLAQDGCPVQVIDKGARLRLKRTGEDGE